MATKSYPSSLLQKYISNEDVLKLSTQFSNGKVSVEYGYLLAEKGNFMLIRKIDDFNLDGYVVLTKNLLTNIRCNKFEKTQKKIIRKEGISKEILTIPLINLNSWQEIFRQMKERDYHVIIECENQDESGFCIGPVKKSNKSSVSVQYYDATGKLRDYLDSIRYENITRLEFLDRYTVIFRKYLKPA